MNFVQVGMLGSLGALAIPVLVHLMFRRQARPVDLGTLQFLKIVLRDNAKRRRLKRYVLLALRLAGVALIAFLFARPYLLAVEPIEGSRLVIVLVDRSATMGLVGGERPIDRAEDEFRAIVGRAGSGTQLEVAAFDRTVTPFAKADDASEAAFEPTFAGTNYGAAMAWARDLCVRSKAMKKELHVLTDLQRSGLDRGESARIPADVDVTLTDLGRAFPKNVGVIGVSVSPEALRPRGTGLVTATIRNASPMPAGKVTVKLRLESEGNESIDLEEAVDLDGNVTVNLEFKLPEMDEALWLGQVEATTGDDLSFDDRRYLAIPVRPATRILLVDGDPGRSSYEAETYFLRAALRLAPDGETNEKSPFDPKTIDVEHLRAGLPDLQEMSAVVLANVGGLSASDASRLAEFVAKGGGLTVFTGDRVTAEGAATLVNAGLGVGKVVGPETVADRPWRLSSWEGSHPVFAPFADPEYGDLRRPSFATITRVEPESPARVMARFQDGVPALIEKAVGKGKVLWFVSTCDRSWGNWPRGRMYLPMVHQLVAHASGTAEGGPVRHEVASGDAKPGSTVDDGIALVVNVDPQETETARCTPGDFADRFGFELPKPRAVAPAGATGPRPGDDRLRSDEVWPLLALALGGVLMIEQFLANRTSA